MRYLPSFTALALVLFASTALALRPLPVDAGDSDRPAPGQDGGLVDPVPPAADAGSGLVAATDAGNSVDAGAHPDSGCPDGICCLVLPNWDAGSYDIGALDTGRRRRRVVHSDPGDVPSDGCSASGASSLLWLLPLLATRRRRRV
jgi:hypothetical protein